jgi:hypothetical protein
MYWNVHHPLLNTKKGKKRNKIVCLIRRRVNIIICFFFFLYTIKDGHTAGRDRTLQKERKEKKRVVVEPV